jgi:hypothetical protein
VTFAMARRRATSCATTAWDFVGELREHLREPCGARTRHLQVEGLVSYRLLLRSMVSRVRIERTTSRASTARSSF